MIQKQQQKTIIKRILVTSILTMILVIGMIVILFIKNMIGFNISNTPILHCQLFLVYRYSFFLKQIYMSQFILTSITTIISLVHFIIYLIYFINLRKQQNQIQQNSTFPTQDKIKVHFFMIFFQLVSFITIGIRSVFIVLENVHCYSTLDIIFIALAGLSILVFLLLIIQSCYMKELLNVFSNKKQLKNNEQQLYEELRNLKKQIYNQNGKTPNFIQMKQRLYAQEYHQKQMDNTYNVQKQMDLRQNLLKNFPTGYKQNKGKYPIGYQQLHQDKDNIQNSSSPQFSQNRLKKDKDFTQNQKEILQQKYKNMLQQLDLPLKKKSKFLQLPQLQHQNNPNSYNMKKISLSNQVLSLQFSNNKIQQLQKKQININDNKSTIKKNKYPNNKNDKLSKMRQKINDEHNIFNLNLAPNSQIKQQLTKAKNPQNIDEEGRFYYADLQKINKNKNIFKAAQQNQIIDPNQLYGENKQIISKPERKKYLHDLGLKQIYSHLRQKKLQQVELYKDYEMYLNKGISEFLQKSDNQNNKQQQEQNSQKQEQYNKQKQKSFRIPSPTRMHLHLLRKQQQLNPKRLKLYEQQQLLNLQIQSQFNEYDTQNTNKSHDPSNVFEQDNNDQDNLYHQQIKIKKSKRKNSSKHSFIKQLTRQEKLIKFLRKKYVLPKQKLSIMRKQTTQLSQLPQQDLNQKQQISIK